MVFHWILSDSKRPQVSRTLLSILADLNNAVVWTVSIRPLIFKFSSLCTNPLMTVPSTPITIGITVTFIFQSLFLFLILSQGPGMYLSFCLPSVLPCDQLERQNALFGRLSVGLVVCPRLGDPFVSQHSRNSEYLMFLSSFRLMHLPFIHMVKLKLLAQVPVDHLAHTAVSSLIFSLG